MPQFTVTQYGTCTRYAVVEAEDEADAREKARVGDWEYDFEVMDDEVDEV